MKFTSLNPFLITQLLAAACLGGSAFATDFYWDVNGTTTGTGGAGPWTNANTWRTGSDVGALGNWEDGNTAVLGGTAGSITFTAPLVINQLKFLTGGYSVSGGTGGSLSFNGIYSDSTPTIDASAVSLGVTINAKITGTLNGGLVISHNADITSASARVFLGAAANDFIGDVTVLSGNLIAASFLGNANNKIILKGGALFGNTAGTYALNRDIVVSANSGIRVTGTGSIHMDLASGKSITGSGNLTQNNAGSGEVRLLGDMSGYTGTFENKGGIAVVQTAATSAGAWKLSSGTLKLNTTNNTHIADGAGKSDLLIAGGTLDMNGKRETINGLSGATGTVQNTAGTSTLTLGGGDATASFGGTVGGGAGTLAITKIGSGTQTLSGTNTYTGATTISAGTLVINGNQTSATGDVLVTGTLAGNGGTIGGKTTVNSDGHLAVGNGTAGSVGTETFKDNLTLSSGSIFDWDLTDASETSGFDKVIGAAGKTFDATDATFLVTTDLTFTGDTFWDTARTWSSIFSSFGTLTGWAANIPVAVYGTNGALRTDVGLEGSFTVTGGTLTWSAVPEPTSALAGLLLGTGLLRRRRA